MSTPALLYRAVNAAVKLVVTILAALGWQCIIYALLMMCNVVFSACDETWHRTVLQCQDNVHCSLLAFDSTAKECNYDLPYMQVIVMLLCPTPP